MAKSCAPTRRAVAYCVTNPRLIHSKKDPVIMVNRSSLTRLAGAGLEIHDCLRKLSLLKLAAKTRALTAPEENQMDQLGFDIGFHLNFLQVCLDQSTAKLKA
jgi:hypothetical protein